MQTIRWAAALTALSGALVATPVQACQPPDGVALSAPAVDDYPNDVPLLFQIWMGASYVDHDPLDLLSVQVSGDDGLLQGELRVVDGGARRSGWVKTATIGWFPNAPLAPQAHYELQAVAEDHARGPYCFADGPCVLDEKSFDFAVGAEGLPALMPQANLVVTQVPERMCVEESEEGACERYEPVPGRSRVRLDVEMEGAPRAFAQAYRHRLAIVINSDEPPTRKDWPHRANAFIHHVSPEQVGAEICVTAQISDVLSRRVEHVFDCVDISDADDGAQDVPDAPDDAEPPREMDEIERDPEAPQQMPAPVPQAPEAPAESPEDEANGCAIGHDSRLPDVWALLFGFLLLGRVGSRDGRA